MKVIFDTVIIIVFDKLHLNNYY